MWDEKGLDQIIKDNFKGHKLVIVSHRQPFIHSRTPEGKTVVKASVGGVSVTFNSIMKAAKGVWVAIGDTEEDKKAVDSHDKVKVPPKKPSYELKRVWISNTERTGYYDGFSNQALWPLCHVAFINPKFSDADWQDYQQVNRRVAEAVLEEITDKKAVVWIQDYQLTLVSKFIKQKRPDVIIGQFWHIPWPPQEIFRVCPWGKEIIEGLLHNDLIGFHRHYQAHNFLRCVSGWVESIVDFEDMQVSFGGQKTQVGIFPISVDSKEIAGHIKGSNARKTLKKYLTEIPEFLAVGVDRVDYTKGIPNRLLAIEKFLDTYPQYVGKFTYLGVGSPSRLNIAAYKRLNFEIEELVSRINTKFGKNGWQPVVYIRQTVDRNDILDICKIADLALVTPLDDGMNLFAKEYIAANDGHGALILSYFTGVAKSTPDAFLINPFDISGLAATIKDALTTNVEDKKARMSRMKQEVANNNVFKWAGKFLLRLAKLNENS